MAMFSFWWEYISGTSTPTSAASRAPTSASAPVSSSFSRSTDGLFKQVMKAYMEAQTQPSSAPNQRIEPREQSLKARLPNLYFGKSHLEPNLFRRLAFSAGVTAADELHISVAT